MSRLNREQIFSCPDVMEREVEVPEWGGSVLLRTLTKAKQVSVRKQAMNNGQLDDERLEVFLFIAGVIDPVFTPEDYEALRAKSAAAMDRVLTEIYRGSGMTKEEGARIERAFPDGASEI